MELFTAATVLTLPDDAAALELFTVTELLLPLGKAPDPGDATDAWPLEFDRCIAAAADVDRGWTLD